MCYRGQQRMTTNKFPRREKALWRLSLLVGEGCVNPQLPKTYSHFHQERDCAQGKEGTTTLGTTRRNGSHRSQINLVTCEDLSVNWVGQTSYGKTQTNFLVNSLWRFGYMPLLNDYMEYNQGVLSHLGFWKLGEWVLELKDKALMERMYKYLFSKPKSCIWGPL